jgi:hypothetical protein
MVIWRDDMPIPVGSQVFVGVNPAIIKACHFSMQRNCYVYQLEWNVDNDDGTRTWHLTPEMTPERDFTLKPVQPAGYGQW